MSNHLKPCPFCGGDASFNEHTDGCYFTVLRKLKADPPADLSRVPDLIEAWNTRTAIQQAGSEPVGFVDFQGTVFWHDGPPPADSLLFAAKPVSHDKEKWCEYVAGMVFAWLEMQENLKEEDRCIKAITGIIERRMWALPTTHPAPGVPDGYVLVPIEPTEEMLLAYTGGAITEAGFRWCRHQWAAMLAAAQAQKGQP